MKRAAQFEHVALAPYVDELVEKAQGGDSVAMGMLYGQAAAIIGAGLPLPAPLAKIFGERLAAIAKLLLAPTYPRRGSPKVSDLRGWYDSAVLLAPPPKGRRPGRLNRTLAAASAAADMTAVRGAGIGDDEREAIIERLAAFVHVDPDTLRKRMMELRRP